MQDFIGEFYHSRLARSRSIIVGMLYLLAGLGFFLWMSRFAFYGLDFSDEGFYLNWIANPQDYSVSYTHFGYLYAPLFNLLGEDVARLRIAGLAINFGLACLLVYLLLVSVLDFEKDWTLIALAAFMAIPVFLSSGLYFLITPSYNSANLQAIMFTLAACLLIHLRHGWLHNWIFWVMLGLGGLIMALAKPTTAILFGAAVFVVLLLTRRMTLRNFAIAGVSAVGFFCAFAVLLDGSLSGFIERVEMGVRIVIERDSSYSYSNLGFDNFFGFIDTFRDPHNRFLPGLIVSLGVLSFKSTRKLMLRGDVILVVCVIIVLLAAMGSFSTYRPLSAYGIAIGAVLAGIGRRLFENYPIKCNVYVWVAFLLLLPPIYAFGSNSLLWRTGSDAIFFPILAFLIMGMSHYPNRDRRIVASFAAFILAVFTAVFVNQSANKPYRQSVPLLSMTHVVKLGGGQLLIQESFATYLSDFSRLAYSNGFTPNTGIIDLSGRVPTLPFAIGGRNIMPWMNGAYNGSIPSARLALSTVACETLHDAWLIAEPGGPRELPFGAFVGQDILPEDYELVGDIFVPQDISGHRNAGNQKLYRPIAQNKGRFCQLDE